MMLNGEGLPDLSYFRMRASGDAEAVYEFETGHRYSYKDLEHRSTQLAWFLKEKLGVKKGDRIGVCTQNSMPIFDLFFAASKTGVILATYNCMLKDKELMGMMENERPCALFYAEEYGYTMKSLRLAFPECKFISLGEKSDDDWCSYEEILKEDAPDHVSYERPHLEDIAMLVHTGGTTGIPKAAMISWRSLICGAISEVASAKLSARDSVVIFLPLFHIGGWNAFTLCMLLIGGRVIIPGRFEPGKTLRIIREERPTLMGAVETMYKAMAKHEDFEKTDFSCFELLFSSAAAIARQTLELYWNKGTKLFNTYGMTELGANNMFFPAQDMTMEEIQDKWNSCGKPMYFNEVRIVDEEGHDVEEGTPGEMIFRSPLLFSGYWKHQEETEKVLVDGWAHSGDVGYRDKDGFYYICGRKKNMFISGGENIFPLEVEEVIRKCPGVEDCCLIGVPDARWGEVGRALLVEKEGEKIDVAAFKEFMKEHISSIKIPRYVTIVKEIPKNVMGKRDQTTIRRLYGSAEN